MEGIWNALLSDASGAGAKPNNRIGSFRRRAANLASALVAQLKNRKPQSSRLVVRQNTANGSEREYLLYEGFLSALQDLSAERRSIEAFLCHINNYID
jgi:hypothetical protein